MVMRVLRESVGTAGNPHANQERRGHGSRNNRSFQNFEIHMPPFLLEKLIQSPFGNHPGHSLKL
jgi:hypothetical protein